MRSSNCPVSPCLGTHLLFALSMQYLHGDHRFPACCDADCSACTPSRATSSLHQLEPNLKLTDLQVSCERCWTDLSHSRRASSSDSSEPQCHCLHMLYNIFNKTECTANFTVQIGSQLGAGPATQSCHCSSLLPVGRLAGGPMVFRPHSTCYCLRPLTSGLKILSYRP